MDLQPQSLANFDARNSKGREQDHCIQLSLIEEWRIMMSRQQLLHDALGFCLKNSLCECL